jgi:plastocyanin
VDVRLRVSAARKRPSVAALGVATRAAAPDRARSVVYLETAPRGAFEPPPATRARLDQRDESFVPYVLPVAVGTTVDFPNNDPVFHNVFSLSKTQRFDLGRYAAGHSKSVRFDRPGIVRVFCDIHSHMSAFILVFAHRFFTATDADGRFEIPDVPAGHYVLVVWTDGTVRERREIDVPGGPAVVTADFVVE